MPTYKLRGDDIPTTVDFDKDDYLSLHANAALVGIGSTHFRDCPALKISIMEMRLITRLKVATHGRNGQGKKHEREQCTGGVHELVQEAHNGGINRAGSNETSIRVLRMKDSLIPLRFNDLLWRRPYHTRFISAKSRAKANPSKPRFHE